MLNKKEDEEDKDKIAIYTHPQTFGKVPLSSLEGYFVSFSDNSITKRPWIERLSELIPQLHVKRDRMRNLEEEYNGKFYPFEK